MLSRFLQSVYKNLTLFASEADFHAEPTIGPALGLEQGEVARLAVSWVHDKF